MSEPLVSKQEISSIAIATDNECGYLARTGDTLVIGMMVIAMGKLQKIYEAKLASVTSERDALRDEQAQWQDMPATLRKILGAKANVEGWRLQRRGLAAQGRGGEVNDDPDR